MSQIRAAPRNPIGAAPLRRPGSIRRTSSIDTNWPEGRGLPMHMRGHARDLITPADGSAAFTCAEDRIDVVATQMREILDIVSTPPRAGVAALIGKRAGGHLRAVLEEALPDERAAGTPLYLLLDDLSGASLVAGWAWSQWDTDWLAKAKRQGAASTAGRGGKMEGICIGFAPGSSALLADGSSSPSQSSTAVVPLENPADALGWHPLVAQGGVGMRRARRIDIWRDGNVINIDSGFQDSATSPAGGRVAIHEYGVRATADMARGELTAVTADPRILPYPECPGAAGNVQRLVGVNLLDLRKTVLSKLAGTAGCTHLNDVLRALAEVPQLLEKLRDNGKLQNEWLA